MQRMIHWFFFILCIEAVLNCVSEALVPCRVDNFSAVPDIASNVSKKELRHRIHC